MADTLDELAINQLLAYEKAAKQWPTRLLNVCGLCNQNIYFATDVGGNEFKYTDAQILALKVAHIRQCHAEVVS